MGGRGSSRPGPGAAGAPEALPAALSAFVLSYYGAMMVSLLLKEWLRPLILALLIIVTVYIYVRKDLVPWISTGRMGVATCFWRCCLAG